MKCAGFTSSGFTMIELVVTMAVAGILFAVGLPSFLQLLQNNRLSGQASSLVFSLNYARSEAIKRNKSAGITVCASSTGTACAGTSWASGWIVLDPVAPLVLLATPALSNNNTLTTGAGSTLTFNPDGSASAAATYTFCDSRGVTFARDVEVSTLGSVQASQKPGKTVSGAAIAGC